MKSSFLLLNFLLLVTKIQAQDIIFYEHDNQTGQAYNQWFIGKCSNGLADLGNGLKASSVNTQGKCVMAYAGRDCRGLSVLLEPDGRNQCDHKRLSNCNAPKNPPSANSAFNFNDMAQSFSECSPIYVAGGSCQTQYQNAYIDGLNLATVPGELSSCCKTCVNRDGCKAWNWYNPVGGTPICQLKGAIGWSGLNGGNDNKYPVMYAQGVTSAYRECMDRFINQDIEGQDMGAVGGQEYQCCGICQNTNGCKAYVWGNWNGGTCFLKSARGPIKSSSSGTILALMNLCPTKYPDYDIPGNDLGGVSGQADQCCEFCKSNSACKAYAWSNWNGGTCWLKSVIGPLVSNTGVTVGIL